MTRTTPSFLRKFIALGTTSEMNDLEIRRIRLLNIFFIIGTVTYLASTIQTFLVDGKQEGMIILGLGIAFEIGIIFLLLNKVKLAEFHLFTITNATIFIFDNHHGPSNGTFLFYFPLMIIIGFLVDFRRFYHAIFHLGISISFLVAGIFLRYKFLYQEFPADQELSSYQFNLVLSALVIAVLSVIIVRIAYIQNLEFISRINERKISEDSLKIALKEKETLIAEVHHRVKNNLAVISSLLNLQMNEVKNEYTKNVLLESRNRVASMALIHQKLYQNSNVEQIDFDAYAKELVEEIKNSYPRSSLAKIEIHLSAEHLPLSLTKAVPCGLILNELLSNCYKHAFPEDKQGEINIRFFASKENSKIFILEVADNGIGFSREFESDKQDTLGMTIIHSLADQLDGKIEFVNNQKTGTMCRLIFTAF